MYMSFGWKRYMGVTAALVYFWTALTPGAQSAPDAPQTTRAARP